MRVDCQIKIRTRADVSSGIDCPDGKRMRAIGQCRRRERPIPSRIGKNAGDLAGAVEEFHRAVRLGGSCQRDHVGIGDPISDDIAVGRERGDDGRAWRQGIDGDGVCGGGGAGVTGGVGGGGGEAVRTLGERRGGEAPGAGAIGGSCADEHRAVVELDRAVGLGVAAERERARIGEVVADDVAVGREPGNRRGDRRHRVDRDGICGGDGAAVAKLQAPVPLATALPMSVAPSKTLTVLLASAVPVSVKVFASVRWSPTTLLSGENAAIVGAAGASVSTMTASAADAGLKLPFESTATALKLWAPLASVAVAKLQLPLASAVRVPIWVAPS